MRVPIDPMWGWALMAVLCAIAVIGLGWILVEDVRMAAAEWFQVSRVAVVLLGWTVGFGMGTVMTVLWMRRKGWKA